MANRFWVGGNGNWSDNVNHWSASSGGAPGASKPALVDDVIIDANSGAGIITLDENADMLSMDFNNAGMTLACISFTITLDYGSTKWNWQAGTFLSGTGTLRIWGHFLAASCPCTFGTDIYNNIIIGGNPYGAIAIQDTLFLKGNLYSDSMYNYNTGNIEMVGSSAIQTIGSTGWVSLFGINLTINKSAGKVEMATNVNVTTFNLKSGNNFDVTASNYILYCEGNFTNAGNFNPRQATIWFGYGTITPGTTIFYNVEFTPLYYSWNLEIIGKLFINHNLNCGKDYAETKGTIEMVGTGLQIITAGGSWSPSVFKKTKIIINNVGGRVEIGENDIHINELEINAGSEFDLSASNNKLRIGDYYLPAGVLINNGTFTARQGTVEFPIGALITPGNSIYYNVNFVHYASAVFITGNFKISGNLYSGKTHVYGEIVGTLELVGNGNQSIYTDALISSFYHTDIIINKTGGIVDMLGSGIEAQSLTITSGIFNCNGFGLTVNAIFANNGTIQLKGDETITGTPTNAVDSLVKYTAPTGSRNIKNWTYSKIEIAGAGTFVFNIAKTFKELKASANDAKLTFGNGLTFIVTNFYLAGSLGHNIILRSASVGNEWFLNVSGLQSVNFVDVQDSNASGGITIFAINSSDSGNNTNWRINFGAIMLANGFLTDYSIDEGETTGASVRLIGTATPLFIDCEINGKSFNMINSGGGIYTTTIKGFKIGICASVTVIFICGITGAGDLITAPSTLTVTAKQNYDIALIETAIINLLTVNCPTLKSILNYEPKTIPELPAVSLWYDGFDQTQTEAVSYTITHKWIMKLYVRLHDAKIAQDDMKTLIKSILTAFKLDLDLSGVVLKEVVPSAIVGALLDRNRPVLICNFNLTTMTEED